MSTALFIIAERDVPGLNPYVNGKPLAHEPNLDRVAKAAGVRPLMEFFSVDPEEAAAMMEDLGQDPPAEGFPAEAWFEAAEGLATVRGLSRQVGADPSAVRDPEAVLEDLRGFEEVLSGLQAAGVRWHLSVDF
ncbi:hypothetical protein [Aquisphaera insulae]|uniref:hypothetical protein n=1 Tax=Aquisphaera insulae TaxID=2712864 RepID=UPI0013EBA042|nr:hypothetical protein [Aquisphaera insulae]